ncbi:MAG: copper-binding protein [Nitratireductor sp.]
MKTILSKFLGAVALSAVIATGAMAETFVKGVVEKVDVKAKKITIAHEELTDLDMPAMTMVFRPGDDAMLETLEEGAEIEFVAARVEGKLTVTKIK